MCIELLVLLLASVAWNYVSVVSHLHPFYYYLFFAFQDIFLFYCAIIFYFICKSRKQDIAGKNPTTPDLAASHKKPLWNKITGDLKYTEIGSLKST